MIAASPNMLARFINFCGHTFRYRHDVPVNQRQVLARLSLHVAPERARKADVRLAFAQPSRDKIGAARREVALHINDLTCINELPAGRPREGRALSCTVPPEPGRRLATGAGRLFGGAARPLPEERAAT